MKRYRSTLIGIEIVTSKAKETIPDIIDNLTAETSLVSNLQAILRNSNEAKLAVGYFYLNGFNLVKDDFQNIRKLRLIIGNEIPESTSRQLILGMALKEDDETKEYIKEKLVSDLATIDHFEQRKRVYELSELIADKERDYDVRIYTKKRFHPKLSTIAGTLMKEPNCSKICTTLNVPSLLTLE